jgi:hypothetical protein
MKPLDFVQKMSAAKDAQEELATRPPVDVTRFGARRDKLTIEMQHEICSKIVRGSHRQDAAVAAGVSRSTFVHWMLRGKQEPDSKFAVFRRAVEQAEAESSVRVVDAVTTNAMTDGLVGLKFLAQRFPKRWDRKQPQKFIHSGAIELNAMRVLEDRSTDDIKVEISRRKRELVEGTARLLEGEVEEADMGDDDE